MLINTKEQPMQDFPPLVGSCPLTLQLHSASWTTVLGADLNLWGAKVDKDLRLETKQSS